MPTNKFHLDWHSDAVTHCGKVRKHNEDAVAMQPERGVWGVADGMGGHHAGDVASREVVAALNLVQANGRLSAMISDCRSKVGEVNTALFEQGLRGGARLSGSTVVILLSSGTQGAVLWAGDSRAYQLRNGVLKQLTTDHSRINDLIDSGQLAPDDAEKHPDANVITRAVGVSAALDLEARLFDVESEDLYLLCSDGLSRYVDDDSLAQLLSSQQSSLAAQLLLDAALATPARDNISVIVMRATMVEVAHDHTAVNPQQAWSQADGGDDDPTVLDLGD